ncbi:hypothetical protein WN48_02769 [Eufriesea mexicana]|uniref:Fatty acyl-CoA reductase n=1 Tax=Eufriesea mexicana TaxID=516756 RepID=A0A310S717_9HYME|nr:hypothetical protein WN48_02769 [Eufriesea mexicana]
MKTMNMNENCVAELIPVDYAVNALIVTAWAVATKRVQMQYRRSTIYNYHSSWDTDITSRQYMKLVIKYGKQVPSLRSV